LETSFFSFSKKSKIGKKDEKFLKMLLSICPGNRKKPRQFAHWAATVGALGRVQTWPCVQPAQHESRVLSLGRASSVFSIFIFLKMFFIEIYICFTIYSFMAA